MAGADTPQPLTLFEAIIPIAGLIVLVALSYYRDRDACAARGTGAGGQGGAARAAGGRWLGTTRRSRRETHPRAW